MAFIYGHVGYLYHYTFTHKIITNIYIGIVDYFEFKV